MDIDNTPNVWDNGYPSGGNYWSDYTELYSNASEIDASGLWNMPYIIDTHNQDDYLIIPELSSFLVLPMFAIPTLLAAIICKRRRQPT